MAESCWLASLPGAGPCDGRPVRVHLIPRQQIARAIESRMCALRDPKVVNAAVLQANRDERGWVLGCGGPMGVSGHHGMLDSSRKLRIPRHRLPQEVEEFAEELGLGWWLDREYGPRHLATPQRFHEDGGDAPGYSYGPGHGQWRDAPPGHDEL